MDKRGRVQWGDCVTGIKICGIRRAEDIEAVNRVLPDYIGFVFAKSRRQIEAKTAAMLKEKLDDRIEAVGVFVNQEISLISSLYKKGIIDIAQLHGDEDEEYIAELKETCGCRVIRSVGLPVQAESVGGHESVYNLQFTVYSLQCTVSGGQCTGAGARGPGDGRVLADYVLFDTASEQRGGTGKVFDWKRLKGYRGPPFFLAGGLTAMNVVEAVRGLAPFAVDVSSGVETDGSKDEGKIIEFVKTVRGMK